ncbi:MAG: hypothetical protein R2824_23050 [Saprospiraceae bacterium]|nr:hypothetical protein [Lewinella sp.]
MKISLIQLTALCLLFFTSCTQASLFDLDYELPKGEYSKIATTKIFADKTIESVQTADFTGNTTIQLQVVNSIVSPQTGNLIVDLSGSGDLSYIQLKGQQALDLIDANGPPYTQTFPVLSYTAVDQLLRVEFGTGRDAGEDPELDDQQSIIIQDIIVN